MTEKLHKAQHLLLQILRVYGGRGIIVKIKSEDPVVFMVRTFIKRQLTAAGILFPFKEVKKVEALLTNDTLNEERLTVMIHRALIDYEIAYVENAYVQNEYLSDGFVKKISDWVERKREWLDVTFPDLKDVVIEPFGTAPEIERQLSPEEALGIMEEFGYDVVENLSDVTRIFWDLAYKHLPMPDILRQAIIETSKDPSIRKMLITTSKQFNKHIALCALEEDTAASSSAAAEYSKKLKEQKRLMELIIDTKSKLKDALRKSDSRFVQSYDFNVEGDIREFLSWYEAIHKKVPKTFITAVANSLSDSTQFVELCEEHNARMKGK